MSTIIVSGRQISIGDDGRIIIDGKEVSAPIATAPVETKAPEAVEEPGKARVFYVREDRILRRTRAFDRVKALRIGALRETDIVRGLILLGLEIVEADPTALLRVGGDDR